MKKEEAVAGLAYLTACTPGPWGSDTLAAYVEQAMRLQDPNAFMVAMRNLSMRWSKSSRPLPHDISIAYQAEVRQQEMDRTALDVGNEHSIYPSVQDGILIAWEAYQGECRRQGREPNRNIFEKWLGRRVVGLPQD